MLRRQVSAHALVQEVRNAVRPCDAAFVAAGEGLSSGEEAVGGEGAVRDKEGADVAPGVAVGEVREEGEALLDGDVGCGVLRRAGLLDGEGGEGGEEGEGCGEGGEMHFGKGVVGKGECGVYLG